MIERALPEVNIMTVDTKPTGVAMLYGTGLHKLHYLLYEHDRLVDVYGNDNHAVPDHVLDRSRSVSAQVALTFIKDTLLKE